VFAVGGLQIERAGFPAQRAGDARMAAKVDGRRQSAGAIEHLAVLVDDKHRDPLGRAERGIQGMMGQPGEREQAGSDGIVGRCGGDEHLVIVAAFRAHGR
jgi:hypothetical protein